MLAAWKKRDKRKEWSSESMKAAVTGIENE